MTGECVSIDCIFNEKMKKGLCIGVSPKTLSYDKDVIRLCWITQRPTPHARCLVKMQAQMTPIEAIGVGVGLIRASIIGESYLKRKEAIKNEKEEE